MTARVGDMFSEERRTRRALLSGGTVLVLLALVKLLVHLLTAENYGYFRGELRLHRLRRHPAHARQATPAHSVAVAGRRGCVRLLAAVTRLAGLARLADARVLERVRREGGRSLARGVPPRADRHHATTMPLWFAGLGIYLFAREGTLYRALG